MANCLLSSPLEGIILLRRATNYAGTVIALGSFSHHFLKNASCLVPALHIICTTNSSSKCSDSI